MTIMCLIRHPYHFQTTFVIFSFEVRLYYAMLKRSRCIIMGYEKVGLTSQYAELFYCDSRYLNKRGSLYEFRNFLLIEKADEIPQFQSAL